MCVFSGKHGKEAGVLAAYHGFWCSLDLKNYCTIVNLI